MPENCERDFCPIPPQDIRPTDVWGLYKKYCNECEYNKKAGEK